MVLQFEFRGLKQLDQLLPAPLSPVQAYRHSGVGLQVLEQITHRVEIAFSAQHQPAVLCGQEIGRRAIGAASWPQDVMELPE